MDRDTRRFHEGVCEGMAAGLRVHLARKGLPLDLARFVIITKGVGPVKYALARPNGTPLLLTAHVNSSQCYALALEHVASAMHLREGPPPAEQQRVAYCNGCNATFVLGTVLCVTCGNQLEVRQGT